MEKKKKLLIGMIISGLKEFSQGDIPETKSVKILKEMIQIDKYSGEEAGRRGGE